jgi:hypothetical protein
MSESSLPGVPTKNQFFTTRAVIASLDQALRWHRG